MISERQCLHIQRVTLKEIAAQTGVSLTTISKVLNGAADVSASTRALVEEQLRTSGYRPRRSRKRREYIEVALPELDGDWALAVIEGVRESAAEAGLAISLAVSGDRRAPGADWLDDVVRRGPTGIIMLFAGIAPEGRAKLNARGIPFVVIDPGAIRRRVCPPSAPRTGRVGSWRRGTCWSWATAGSRRSQVRPRSCAHSPGSTATGRR